MSAGSCNNYLLPKQCPTELNTKTVSWINGVSLSTLTNASLCSCPLLFCTVVTYQRVCFPAINAQSMTLLPSVPSFCVRWLLFARYITNALSQTHNRSCVYLQHFCRVDYSCGSLEFMLIYPFENIIWFIAFFQLDWMFSKIWLCCILNTSITSWLNPRRNFLNVCFML